MSIELKQSAQQALLALEKSQPHPSNPVIGLTKQDFIDHEETIRQLRAAIQQAEAQQPATGEPDEWKLVPIVPTEEMLLAYTGGAVTNAGFRWCRHQWSAMLAAAPAAHPAPSVPADVMRDAERGRFLVGWLKRFGLLQTELGQIGAGEKPGSWWLLHAPWGIDKTRPFFGHGKTPEQAIDAAMLAAKERP